MDNSSLERFSYVGLLQLAITTTDWNIAVLLVQFGEFTSPDFETISSRRTGYAMKPVHYVHGQKLQLFNNDIHNTGGQGVVRC